MLLLTATTYDSVTKLAAALEAKKPAGAAYSISAGTARVSTLLITVHQLLKRHERNAAVGDKYVIQLVERQCSYTLLTGGRYIIASAADTAARVTYLAGKLDAAAIQLMLAQTLAMASLIGHKFCGTANALVQTHTTIGLCN